MHNLQLALLGVISSVTLTAVYLISKLNPFVQKNQSQKSKKSNHFLTISLVYFITV